MCAITFDWEENDAVMKFKRFGTTRSASWGVIELTDCCNFNCKWCFANSPGAKPFHMDIRNVEKILGALQDAGISQITYSGGEPTVYPHLKEAVSLASNRGMIVHMNTNGFVLTEEMALELKKAGLSQVQINIDSVHHYKHDAVRGRIGSFEKALKALKNARRAGITCVSQTVFTRENEDEIVEILSLARSLGVQRCRVWDMTPSKGCARDNSSMLPNDYITAIQKAADYAQETGARNVEVSDPLFLTHIKTSLHMSGGFCVFGSGIVIYITTRGDVIFCCTLRDIMYNIFEEIERGENIVQVHRNNVSTYLKSFRLPNACHGCEHAGICKGGCYTRRDFSGGIDYWCRHATGNIHSSQSPASPLLIPV